MNLKTSEPFWLIKNGLPQSYPSLRENIKTDILIIGGGITGSLIAHQCIEDGYDTVLIDRREVCNGSTSATTSMLQYEIDVPLWELSDMIGTKNAEKCYHACSDTIDTLGKLAKKVKSDCGFEKRDSLYFAAYKKDIPSLKKEYKARKKAGFPVEWLDKEEIEKKYGLQNTWGGILSAQGGCIDAFTLAHDILKYNTKRGLRIYDKTEIKNTQYGKKSVSVQTETNFEIKAKKIIYCNGFESTEIIPEKFVKLLSTYAMVSERMQNPPAALEKLLIWNTADPYIYMRTTDDGRMLIGGEDEDFTNPEKRDALLPEKAKKLQKSFAKLFPDKDFYPDFVWAGVFGETKDGLPYIGTHPKFPGAYWVLGFGGNGITFSVLGMQLVSDYLKNKKNPFSKLFQFGR